MGEPEPEGAGTAKQKLRGPQGAGIGPKLCRTRDRKESNISMTLEACVKALESRFTVTANQIRGKGSQMTWEPLRRTLVSNSDEIVWD